ncbi:alpha/beta fold hydrolase [Pseudalkalibacillus caeni]|uniref:Alpha/beta hydrolase n=1 Tax=Exobacillus caeni TaxID=2574798 RepID=A0A5R9F3U0_9BACL|nr:alpha/beta hydrolase [Pseudalkalibacillus caeni]TLS37169.1 alpha/beta hydrolase [Pseudalkalibacillus caeni]
MLVRRTRKIKSNYESIALLDKVLLGGLQQNILIRGEDVNNPLMLFLHGGPGTAQIGFAPKFQRELEKDFTVVNWDQRGAGTSYSVELTPEDLTVDKMVNDTVELVEYLLNRFNQPKLFLVGHSWGSLLGILVSQKIPELLYTYIGIGQVVNMSEGERLSYEFTIGKAKELENEKAIKELTLLEFDPFDMNYLTKQRKWLEKFGGSFIGVNTYSLIYSNILFSNEYTIKDWFSFLKSGRFSLNALWESLFEYNFIESVPELKIPVAIFAGKHDYQTPYELAEKYYDELHAPSKKFIWFENSGHLLNFEEPEKFAIECRKIKEEFFVTA